jgi:polyphosphate kinase
MEGEHYFNRELSWIDFNERVLEEGLRKDLLPLDRFKYLSIVSSNFDEFFMVRMAALKRVLAEGVTTGGEAGAVPPAELVKRIAEKTRNIFHRQYRCLEEELLPALAAGGAGLLRPEAWSPAQRNYLEGLFLREIYPLLTPLRIEEGEPLPAIESIRLHAAFLLVPGEGLRGEEGPGEGKGRGEGEKGEERISVAGIPGALDRIIWLPGEPGKSPWALLEDTVRVWGHRLYPGYRVKESILFKVNRDADFSVDERRDEDFIEAMAEALEGRESSMVVRMVYSPGSGRLRDELALRLGLGEDDLYEIAGPLNPGNLYDLMLAKGFDQLREKPWKICQNPAFHGEASLWERISRGDLILHLPYESFDPVVRFFQDAAADPQVVSIKTALYRTSGNSPIIRALEQAGLSGKQVTAVVELKARFDEERNISWANRLERAGVIVVYGLARLKVHAKVSLVMRREKDRIRRYVHLSTGNYNDKTARFYQDIGLFTAREDIAYDAGLLFNMITGYSAEIPMRRLVIAPGGLKRRLLELIDREIRRFRPEIPGRIMAKMNALADPEIIRALYRASRAGVKVYLNIRGICMLVPGLKGLSENIRVISLVDHYLEHSRIFCFGSPGMEEVYLSSADWMPRNMGRRVELMFPVLQEDTKRQVKAILESYFFDNCQAWLLHPEGAWSRLSPAGGEEPYRVQARFLRKTMEGESPGAAKTDFVVRRSPPGQGYS